VYINDTLNITNDWTESPDNISINVDGHSHGLLIYTIIVYDVSGNSVQDIVVVIITEEPLITTTITTTTTTTTTTTSEGFDMIVLIAVGLGLAGVVIIVIVISLRRR